MYEDASIEDIRTILKGSLIQFKKEPVIVSEISVLRTATIKGINPKKKFAEEVALDHPDLDVTPVKLGMCNHGGAAFYTYRRPVRQFSQGLNSGNFSVVDHTKSGKDLAKKEILQFKAKSLYSCIIGEYPDLNKVLETLNEEKPDEEVKVFSLAFSRVFSIDHEMNLFFKMDRVGIINHENGKPVLLKNKGFLKELLYA